MFKLIRKAQRQSQFVDEVLKKRKTAEERYQHQKSSLPPPFNKQHYAVQGQGGVVITGASLKVMERNIERIKDLDYQLPRSDIVTMKSVIEGLTMIHHGEIYVKEVLSHVVCLEVYEPFKYVQKKSNEVETSCYYIITGTAEVTYDGRHGQSLQIFQTDVLYTHSTGEYLGLVSAVSKDKDLAPPSTIYTTEVCEFLKIDRHAFHERIRRLREKMDLEKMEFMVRGDSMLSQLSTYLQTNLKLFMVKEKYEANVVLLEQREYSEYVFFLAEGHCTCLKKVYLPEVQREIILTIGNVERGEFFGEERVTHDRPNYCYIVSKSPVVCFKIYRGAFEARGSLRNELMKLMKKQKHMFPSTETLRSLGRQMFRWEMYKRLEAQNDKDIHQERQMILDCPNLRHTDKNQLYDFMSGSRVDKSTPEQIHADKIFHQNEWVGDLYSSKVKLDPGSCLVDSVVSFDDNENVYDSMADSDFETRSRTVSLSSSRNAMTPRKPKLDSRDILRMFQDPSSRLTVAATVTSGASVQGMSVLEGDSGSDDENPKFVKTESEEIIQRALNAKASFAAKVWAKKHRKAEKPTVQKSVFELERDKANARLTVSRYRATMMARKLRRSKKEQAKDYWKVLNESTGVRPADLSLDIEVEKREGQDTVGDLRHSVPMKTTILPEIEITQEQNSEMRRSASSQSIANRRKRFMRRLSVRLSDNETFLPETKVTSVRVKLNKKSEDTADPVFKDRSKSFSGLEDTYKTPKKEDENFNKLLLRRRTISAL